MRERRSEAKLLRSKVRAEAEIMTTEDADHFYGLGSGHDQPCQMSWLRNQNSISALMELEISTLRATWTTKWSLTMTLDEAAK